MDKPTRQDEGNAIVLYEGSPLERITASSIVTRNNYLMEQKRFYLASDLIVGDYGVTGFIIADTQPEKRWRSYTDGEWVGGTYRDDELGFIGAPGYPDDKGRYLTHCVNTDQGFKMIRYFILPEDVRDFFRTDNFLGDPMIRKCCEEGTIPEEFDEARVAWGYFFFGELEESIKDILRYVGAGVGHITEDALLKNHSGHQIYFSFHPWQNYSLIIEAGEEAVVRAVRNLDRVLGMFDRNKRLGRRELSIEGAQEYRGVLPPIEQE